MFKISKISKYSKNKVKNIKERNQNYWKRELKGFKNIQAPIDYKKYKNKKEINHILRNNIKLVKSTYRTIRSSPASHSEVESNQRGGGKCRKVKNGIQERQ